MEYNDDPLYKNFISSMDIDRSINRVDYFSPSNSNDIRFDEFKQDIYEKNDVIELNLIKSNAYKEAVIVTLKRSKNNKRIWEQFLNAEQKTFTGSKLFYINKECNKILILATPNNIESKLKMVILRINKINEKISRYNLKIKKENKDTFQSRMKNKDKRDNIINLINQNLKA